MNKQQTKISFSIELGNDAFVDDMGFEIGRILRKLGSRMVSDSDNIIDLNGLPIRDLNGNTVGEVCVSWETSIDAMGVEVLTALVEQNLPYWKEAAQLRALDAKVASIPGFKTQLFMVFACDRLGHSWSFDIQSFKGDCRLRHNRDFIYKTDFVLDGINDTVERVVQSVIRSMNAKLADEEV